MAICHAQKVTRERVIYAKLINPCGIGLITIYFNEYLCKTLGFRDKNPILGFTRKLQTYVSEYETNQNAYTPKIIFVTCNIVEDTIFGGECLKLLGSIAN